MKLNNFFIPELKNKRIQSKKSEIKEAIKGELNHTDIFVVKECLEAINFLNNKLKAVDSRISESLAGFKNELEVLMSIPVGHELQFIDGHEKLKVAALA